MGRLNYIGSEQYVGTNVRLHYYQDADGLTYVSTCVGQSCGKPERCTLGTVDLAAIRASTPAWWREKMALEVVA